MKADHDGSRSEPTTTVPADEETEPYSVFSPWQQNTIIGLAALGGWFSSISSFIYFPAIPFLASDLHVSVQQVNLTVTPYLIMSGIFPSIMGDAADRFGRRPVFLVALAAYFGANIGLALQSHFVLLFVLRMLQGAGISGTFSIAYGVLGDLFTPAERGGYSGTISFFVGPVISGLLLLRWTWRSIFWLLTVSSGLCLVTMALFLPETARSIVANGSLSTTGINKPLVPFVAPNEARVVQSTPDVPTHKGRRNIPNPLAALKLLRIPGTAIILLAYGINYTVYCCLQASLSTLFLDIFGVSGLVAGLVYIPFGVAVALSAFATGHLLDLSYKRTTAENGISIVLSKDTDMKDFPVEFARLRTVIWTVTLSAFLVMGYGWSFLLLGFAIFLEFLMLLLLQLRGMRWRRACPVPA